MEFAACLNPNHDQQRIKYICVDTNCQTQKKIGCADCFLEDHSAHQRKLIVQFKDQVTQQIDQISSIMFEQVTDAPQKDLDKKIELELENCIDCIRYRFESIKSDLKTQIDNDSQKLQENSNILSTNVKNELGPFKNTPELYDMNQQEIQNVVKFFQEAPKIQKHYVKVAEQLQDEKQKIRNKKQKYLTKMKNIMHILLKEFSELMTTKNVQYDDGSEFETPQKQQNSPNKMLNFIETVRSSRRFPMTQSKKVMLSTVARKLE